MLLIYIFFSKYSSLDLSFRLTFGFAILQLIFSQKSNIYSTSVQQSTVHLVINSTRTIYSTPAVINYTRTIYSTPVGQSTDHLQSLTLPVLSTVQLQSLTLLGLSLIHLLLTFYHH